MQLNIDSSKGADIGCDVTIAPDECGAVLGEHRGRVVAGLVLSSDLNAREGSPSHRHSIAAYDHNAQSQNE